MTSEDINNRDCQCGRGHTSHINQPCAHESCGCTMYAPSHDYYANQVGIRDILDALASSLEKAKQGSLLVSVPSGYDHWPDDCKDKWDDVVHELIQMYYAPHAPKPLFFDDKLGTSTAEDTGKPLYRCLKCKASSVIVARFTSQVCGLCGGELRRQAIKADGEVITFLDFSDL